ncbi:hypothetical protein CCM_05329 [Cordyceps militaris CM01]|uniref:Uncharacterized protein n=1 Tax=Cordyceps militaris (strain CM01) TaxID=983644 RepID=G3JJ24_CORMM|nr:uncharacterized protein CCM_05329 [Cordyceps militaris CM01]EGX91171.1 hypothetical protein CCM_05329 [Cordyceps militaris CM01]
MTSCVFLSEAKESIKFIKSSRHEVVGGEAESTYLPYLSCTFDNLRPTGSPVQKQPRHLIPGYLGNKVSKRTKRPCLLPPPSNHPISITPRLFEIGISLLPAMASITDTPALPRPGSPTGSPHGPSTTSLQAAATVNAGLHRELSPRKRRTPPVVDRPSTCLRNLRALTLTEAPEGSSTGSLARGHRSSSNAGRRRSNVLMNLQLNDPAVPGPGEMVAEHAMHPPQHHRAPSLGELHQELEAEQEAHVNRLLQMIRQQQLELQRLQASNSGGGAGHGASAEDSSAVSDRAGPLASQGPVPTPPLAGSYPRSPVFHHRPSLDMARADLHRRSRTPSRGASPRLRSTSISVESGDWALGGRDESAFYQAEAQMLTRENQMLKHRIHELQKQLSELSASQGSNEPPTPSSLGRSSSTAADAAAEAEA